MFDILQFLQGTREWLNEHVKLVGRSGSSSKRPSATRVRYDMTHSLSLKLFFKRFEIGY